ncbi:MAG: ATP synthase subunit I [Pseudomonadota bacterium]|nr:ATP synthase subunit I [Pseudomonadota bacterium]|tara:strand:- start:1064 stop:1402 length:339 start_codon:yes stop_codon:yes gene_type:complete
MLTKSFGIEIIIFVAIAFFLGILANKDVAISFLVGVGINIVPKCYSAAILFGTRSRSIKEEIRHFYIAEFGKWALVILMFALVFAFFDITYPFVLFMGFLLACITTIFFKKT